MLLPTTKLLALMAIGNVDLRLLSLVYLNVVFRESTVDNRYLAWLNWRSHPVVANEIL